MSNYQWRLLAPWASGSGPGQHLEAGELIDGQTDKFGALVSASCRGQPVPIPPPLEASPLTQDAADAMSLAYPELLYRIIPGEGVVIRQLVNVRGDGT
jgi:hypothetical protein